MVKISLHVTDGSTHNVVTKMVDIPPNSAPDIAFKMLSAFSLFDEDGFSLWVDGSCIHTDGEIHDALKNLKENEVDWETFDVENEDDCGAGCDCDDDEDWEDDEDEDDEDR